MKRLTTQLVILLMLALMIITGMYDYVRLVGERDRLVELTREEHEVFAETLTLAVSRNVRRGRTTEELKELLDDILRRPELVWVAIYDPKGRVVATSVATGNPSAVGDDVIRDVLRSKAPASEIIAGAGGQDLRSVRPFRWSDGRTAAVEIRHSLQRPEREFNRKVREGILSRLVVLAFFVVSVIAVARWSIARPIQALIRGARAVGRGDLGERIDLKRSDEVGQLADEFNRMASSLQRAREALLRQAEERLRLEQEVQQAQKLAAVGMLAAEVAHEVGTPLNVLSGRAEALARTLPGNHPGRRHLEIILGQTDRITGTIRSLLDYTRPRRPTLSDEPVPPLLARVGDLLGGRYRGKGVALTLDLPRDVAEVAGDPDQLQQVFLNLLVNALDASPRGGTVRVTVGDQPVLSSEDRAGITRGKAHAPCLAIHIVDQGPGMTADQLAHVFEPFFSTKKRGQGTGLGLPIVEEIVRAHHGEVEILSVPGHGTEVIVRLPLADADGRPSRGEPEGPDHER
jgi:signal transduction histidine kinase